MQTWFSLIISQHDMMRILTLQHSNEAAVRTSVSLTTTSRPSHWVSPDIQTTLNSLRRSVGRRPAKSAFMFLFALMSISHNLEKTCSADSFRSLWKPFSYQRNAQFIISLIRLKQRETNGAWRFHKPPPSSLDHQTTHFNINGSIICSWHHHFRTRINHEFSSLFAELCVLTKITIIS